jgi:hypothetical protein
MDAVRRLVLLGVLVAAAQCAAAGIASADTLCVGSPGGTCNASFSGDGTGLQGALNSANSVTHPGDDTVLIDAGTYGGPFTYGSNSHGHVAVVGAGTAQTTLNISPAPLTSQSVITLGPSGESISGLTIAVNATSDTVTHTEIGLNMTDSTATDIAVTSDTSENVTGAGMNGGTLQQSSITFVNGVTTGNTGVSASGAVDVHDVSVVAQNGINHTGTPGTVSRASITSTFEGIEETGGTISVDDSLITVVKTSCCAGKGIAADNRNNTLSDNDMTINGRHLTIVGSGVSTVGALAVTVGNDANPDTAGLADATVNLADSVIFGPAGALSADADNHRTSAINTTYSAYDSSTVLTDDHPSGVPGFPVISPTNLIDLMATSPGFVNPGIDFHLGAGSALIDAGDPAAGGPATDRDGNPRVVDGQNVCPLSPRRDIGAFEFSPGAPADCTPATTAPPDTRIDKGPKKKTTRRKVKFVFSADQPGATFMCRLDRRPFAPCTSPAKFKVKPGKHTFQAEAVTAAGTDSTPATKKFRVVP